MLPTAVAAAVAAVVIGTALAQNSLDGPREADTASGLSAQSPNPGSSSPTPTESTPITQGSPDESTSPDASPQTARLRPAAEAFAAFAGGGRSDVPWAPIVTVFVGGEETATFSAKDATDAAAWMVCPSEGKRELHTCPLSPLATMSFAARDGVQLVYESTPPDVIVGCSRLVGPAGLANAASITIRPDLHHRDCFSDFAVTLYASRSGEVAGVNLVLSGP